MEHLSISMTPSLTPFLFLLKFKDTYVYHRDLDHSMASCTQSKSYIIKWRRWCDNNFLFSHEWILVKPIETIQPTCHIFWWNLFNNWLTQRWDNLGPLCMPSILRLLLGPLNPLFLPGNLLPLLLALSSRLSGFFSGILLKSEKLDCRRFYLIELLSFDFYIQAWCCCYFSADDNPSLGKRIQN